IYMSDVAKRRHVEWSELLSVWKRSKPAEQRQLFEHFAVDPAKAAYPVSIEKRKIADVHVLVFTPRGGISKQNKDWVLINLHGGGWSIAYADLIELIESIPISSIGKVKVISVDYRQAPQYRHPAAIEDVAAVYQEVIKEYRPQNVGIYGCSA